MRSVANLTSAFDINVQVVECANCGAPVPHLPSSGEVTCEYCDAVLRLVPRSPPTTDVAEVARPEPGATFEYEPSPERDAWTRAALAAGSVTPHIDLDACAPPDLAHLGKPAHASAWENERIPALRPRWQQAIQQLRGNPGDPGAAKRVYWLASRLSWAYTCVAATRGGQEQRDLNLRRRAVLETGLGLLEQTDFGYALRCQLAQAASQLGDTAAARGWLAPCDPHPDSVELDGELRLAMASIYSHENNRDGILSVLGTAESPVPVYGRRAAVLADCYRIHAYEMLGDTSAWSTMLKYAMGRHSWALIRGTLQTNGLAPRARGRVLTHILVRLGLACGAVVAIGVTVALLIG